MDEAVTAPVESAGPRAVTHWPTARAAAVVEATWVYVVDDDTVTVREVVALVEGFVCCTVIVEPLTAVTSPLAPPKAAAPPGKPCPDGCLVITVPEGAEPPAVAVGRGPPKPGPPPKPTVHAPETGWLIRTVVALTGPATGGVVVGVVVFGDFPFALALLFEPAVVLVIDLAEPVETLGCTVGAPKALTHDPTVTAARVADDV
jgi:hypothetical protein